VSGDSDFESDVETLRARIENIRRKAERIEQFLTECSVESKGYAVAPRALEVMRRRERDLLEEMLVATALDDANKFVNRRH